MTDNELDTAKVYRLLEKGDDTQRTVQDCRLENVEKEWRKNKNRCYPDAVLRRSVHVYGS